jgi:hypothetical protein
VLVDQSLIDAVNGKIRRRVLHLPVERGKLPEPRHPKTGRVLRSPRTRPADPAAKRCPMKAGGIYTLSARRPLEQYREQAKLQPTRARAVLAWIERCEDRTRTITITVLSVERQDDEWIIHFEKGNRQDLLDRDVFLSRQNDFTMDQSRQTVKGDPPLMTPFDEDLARARNKAVERASPQWDALARMRADAETLREAMVAMKDRNGLALLHRAERELEKLSTRLSVDSGATFPVIGSAERQDVRPNSTEPPVSPELAA